MSGRHQPMLATPWPQPFSDPRWLFEPKWDGTRAIVSWEAGSVVVRNRRGAEITDRYPELSAVRLPGAGVIDGEIIVPGVGGIPSFERLQQRIHLTGGPSVRRAAADHPVTFIAFDLLDDGRPRIELGVEERRSLLEGVGLGPPMSVGHAVTGDGQALWSAVEQLGLEGMVAKRLGSRYRPGIRSPDWRKIVRVRTLRAVVGGFTPGERGRRSAFGSLVLGLWDGGRMRWIGNVGSGFTDAELRGIRAALDQMVRSEPPFHRPADLPPAVVWVEPALVARVGYREWTAAGRIRQPTFTGFTDDPPESATWEAEGPGS